MKISLAILLFALGPVPSIAGTITGIVRAEGKPEVEAGSKGGKYESRRYKFVERIDYDQLRDFVIYIDFKPTNAPAPPAKPVEVITQKDAVFRPHVMPVVVGTEVEWPNRDEIYHNVFSISDPKPFDLGLYRHPTLKKVTFDKPGRVDVFCSIHTRMNCVILVLENPWFSAADEEGHYRIENVPAGTYKLKAWHERLPSQEAEVVVPEKGGVRVDFTMGIKNLPKY